MGLLGGFLEGAEWERQLATGHRRMMQQVNRSFPIVAWADGRPALKRDGCAIHSNVCDVVTWQNGQVECLLCARDRQEEYMTPEQRRNPAFHMPPYWEWKPPSPPVAAALPDRKT